MEGACTQWRFEGAHWVIRPINKLYTRWAIASHILILASSLWKEHAPDGILKGVHRVIRSIKIYMPDDVYASAPHTQESNAGLLVWTQLHTLCIQETTRSSVCATDIHKKLQASNQTECPTDITCKKLPGYQLMPNVQLQSIAMDAPKNKSVS